MRLLALLILLASPAWAACPGTPADCFYGLIHIHTSLSADWATHRVNGAGCCHDSVTGDTTSTLNASCVSTGSGETAETNCEPETLFAEYRLAGWNFVFVSDHYSSSNLDAADWTAIKAAAVTVNAYGPYAGESFLAVPGFEYTPNGVTSGARGHMGIYGSGLAALPTKPGALQNWTTLCQWVVDPNGDGDTADSQAGDIILTANHPGASNFAASVDFSEKDQAGNFTIQYPAACTGLVSGFEVDGKANWERRRVYSPWQSPSQIGASDWHDDQFWSHTLVADPAVQPVVSSGEVLEYTICDLDGGGLTWPDTEGTLTEANLFHAMRNGMCWDAEWARITSGSRDTSSITAFPSSSTGSGSHHNHDHIH